MVMRMMALAAAMTMVPLGAATARAETKCHLDFHLEGWSAFYETAHGAGRITCDNDQSRHVVIRTKGGGVTFGKRKIVNGRGTFSDVDDISDLFGDYAKAEAHAGAGKSTDAQVVTKGDVSLALSGEGRGVDLGFAFGKFSLIPAKSRPRTRVRPPDEPAPLDEAPLRDEAPPRDEPPPRHEGY